MSPKYDFNLKAPIVFFDLETTGTNVQADRIVEICMAKLSPGGELEVKTKRINPERHIPEEASAVHGIYDADVADAPTFKMLSSLFKYALFKAKAEQIFDVADDSAEELKIAAELGIKADNKEDVMTALELAAEELKYSYQKIQNLVF